MQLRATETSTSESNSNTTTVILTIEDMNDNSPIFIFPDGQATTAVNVTEHETHGVVLATFTATDADSGNFGTLYYYLEKEAETHGKFAINESSVSRQDAKSQKVYSAISVDKIKYVSKRGKFLSWCCPFLVAFIHRCW